MSADLHGEEPEEREVVPLEHVAHDPGNDSTADRDRGPKLLLMTSGGVMGGEIAVMARPWAGMSET